MKTIVITLFLLFFSASFFAQDIIYTTLDEKIEAKVLEVGTSEIKYKKWSYLEGPTYSLLKSDVVLITYENGSFERFENTTPARPTYSDRPNPFPRNSELDEKLKTDFGRNILSFNISDMLASRFSLGYEHIFKNGKWSLKIPVSLGFGEETYYIQNLYFRTGLGINHYPTGQGRVQYFAGTLFTYGLRRNGSGYYNPSTGTYFSNTRLDNVMAGFVTNGINYQVTEHFNLSAVGGIGFEDTEGPSWAVPLGLVEINLGVRF